MDEARARDLDETRRLLYMVLAAKHTTRYEIVGTVANALLHHQQVNIDRDELLTRLVNLVEGIGDDPWLQQRVIGLVEEMTDELDRT